MDSIQTDVCRPGRRRFHPWQRWCISSTLSATGRSCAAPFLLAMLGYGAFIVSSLFDLGLPWHIYMPILHWQHHSVMFEIAWCVMLYFSVLVMEFTPVILEHPRFQHPLWQRIAHLLHRLTIPVVIAGIVLSTLHQSSLGGLFLMMPHRVHPLWYSPSIPVLFFTSAIAAGLAALIVESFLAVRLFGIRTNQKLLAQIGALERGRLMGLPRDTPAGFIRARRFAARFGARLAECFIFHRNPTRRRTPRSVASQPTHSGQPGGLAEHRTVSGI